MSSLKDLCSLSFYKELAPISDHENITLVQHQLSGQIYVKKILQNSGSCTLHQIMDNPHKNVCKLIELFDDDPVVVIEEFITGYTLEEIVSDGPLPEAKAVPVILDICEGLSHLHNLSPPVIHRDIKPSNIMVTEDGIVKIIDFNASRLYKAAGGEDTVILGTAGYASPEQFGFRETDARSDIYSLGVLMNFLLTGKHPKEETYQGRLTNVIQKAMSLSPEDRYQDIGKLKAAVGSAARIHANSRPQQAQETPAAKRKFSIPVPGFRSRRVWKMLLAAFGYFFMVSVALGFKSTGNIIVDIANKSCFLALFLLLVFLYTNYLHIRDHLPLFNSKKRIVQIAGYILFSFLAVVICGTLFAIIKSTFIPGS